MKSQEMKVEKKMNTRQELEVAGRSGVGTKASRTNPDGMGNKRKG